MLRLRQLLRLLPFLSLILLATMVSATENDKSMNVALAMELLTNDGIDVTTLPNQYEQFVMDLVVQLDATQLDQLRQMADKGNDDAQTVVGLIYSLPNEAGRGQLLSNMVVIPSPEMRNYVDNFKLPVTDLVERDPNTAIEYLEKAAAQENTFAETLLAETIMQKEGSKPDFKASRDYFHRAALKNHIRAQIGLLQVSAILGEDVDPVIMRKIFSEMTGQ
ncbi:tetratricopeptide repeat protein [Methylophaga sp.]|uniref:tetratricopeptide repeat protein n=1 Tax=Methylophaga sp. TaxID=2024840 RepID=UPI003F6A017B